MESTRVKDHNHKEQLAISLARESRWAEALLVNKEILLDFPNKLESLNRLDKAHLELGQYKKAKEAFLNTLREFPNNAIAKKELGSSEPYEEIPN